VIGGFGLGLFVTLIISVVLAGIGDDDAGAASGALATLQQVGGAVGIAVVGVLFFGFIAGGADRASATAVPALRAALTAAHLPEPAVRQTVDGFRHCFHDRTNQRDLSSVPASCERARRQGDAALAAAPPDVRAAVGTALQAASGRALATDFRRAAARTTVYEVTVFTVALLLVLALPRVDAERIDTRQAGPA